MARKIICPNCGKKVDKKYDFCPYCGAPLNKEKRGNWGMLGKRDVEEESYNKFPENLLSGIGGGILNKMLGSAMKMLEKEMRKEMSRGPDTNIHLMINGKEIKPQQVKQIKKQAPNLNFSKEILKKFSKLPKKEPKTNIRRLSDKIIYEIKVPGVKTFKDLSITKLEKGIKIDAVAKDKAYSKVISVNLPIVNYELSRGTLVLELEARN